MRQGYVNAWLLWLCYGIMCKSVMLVYVNRAPSVYLVRLPFRPSSSKQVGHVDQASRSVLKFLRSFVRDVPSLYTDRIFLLREGLTSTLRTPPPEALSLVCALRCFETGVFERRAKWWEPVVAPAMMLSLPRMYKIADGVFLWSLPVRYAYGGNEAVGAFADWDGARSVSDLRDENRNLRKALCDDVDAACKRLLGRMTLERNGKELYYALYAWFGQARMYPRSRSITSSTPPLVVLIRTFHRLVNHTLLEEMEANGAFGDDEGLDRNSFRDFSHASQRHRWSDFQLNRARHEYVSDVENKMEEVLDLL